MLYPIVRPMAALAFRIFFKKIYMNGLDQVPKNKPVMLVANHPTTFIEPCILACFMDRPIYYLVRGDFFQNPIFGALMRDLHMIPIYRMKDGGFGSLKNNYDTFAACHQWLSENKTIMVLAEGSAIYEKRLRPLRKGAARIAMGTMEKYPEMELYVVPLGINFTDSNQFGSQAYLNFAKPFLAKPYYDIHLENPAKAARVFTDKLREQLKENIIIIDQERDDWLTNQLLDMSRNDHPVASLPKVIEDRHPFEREKNIANWVNQLDEPFKQQLKEDCKNYNKELVRFKVSDDVLASPESYRSKSLGIVLVGAIPAIFGYFTNILPFQLMRYITNNIVIFNEFFGSVRIASSIGTYLVYYIILLLSLIIGFGIKGIVYFSIVPMLGFIAIKYYDYYQKWRLGRNFRKLKADTIEMLRNKRNQILAQVKSSAYSNMK